MALFAEDFGKAFVFKSVRPKIRKFFLKAGYEDVPYELFGWLFYVSLAITYFVYIILAYPKITALELSSINMLLLTFLSWVVIQAILLFLMVAYLFFSLNIRIYQRKKS